jgi:hypothetical protein
MLGFRSGLGSRGARDAVSLVSVGLFTSVLLAAGLNDGGSRVCLADSSEA